MSKSYKVSFRPSDAVYVYSVEADDKIEAGDKAYEMLRADGMRQRNRFWYIDDTKEVGNKE